MDESNGPKHEAILNAAARIFSSCGFARSRIEDIASAAGVGKGTVYEYFLSKQQLLLQCCLNRCRQQEQIILSSQTNLDQVSDDYPAVMAHLIHTVITTVVGSDGQDLRLFMQLLETSDQEPALASEARQRIQALYQEWEDIFLRLYEAGIEAGSFCAWPDRHMPGRLLTAVVDGWVWQTEFREELNATALADQFVANLMPLLTVDERND